MQALTLPHPDLSQTGFQEDVRKPRYGFMDSRPSKAKSIIASLLLLGTGATQLNQYYVPGQGEIIISEEQLQQENRQINSFLNSEVTPLFYEQLHHVKRCLGLNILELAAILQVSRPTIYEWMKLKNTPARKKNQARLKELYGIGQNWQARQLGQLGSHLHKPLGQSNFSLFSLLQQSSLDLKEINLYLDSIAQIMVAKHQKDAAHEALLKKHGFEPMSKKDMEDSFNDIDFMD